jgi:DNA-3-methyladenine glycosylase
MILKKSFYQKNTLYVAQDLLGCFLVRKINGRIIKGIITETEAYIGEDDLACHASRGRTPRTEIMYGEAGQAYVYMIYGMYHCLNIVTERKNFPAAVLIRGIKIVDKNPPLLNKERVGVRFDGPGKLCKFLKIDRKLNGLDLTRGKKLWIEKGLKIKNSKIKNSRRVGLDYAKHCKHYLWRFYINAIFLL